MRDLLRPESDCPGFALRRLHAGELEGDEASRVREHVESCVRCAATWKRLGDERAALPAIESFRVGVVLADLRPARSATPSLFEEDRKAAEVSRAMDEVNAEFGASVVHFGAMHGFEDAAPTRIAWTQIPDFDRRVS